MGCSEPLQAELQICEPHSQRGSDEHPLGSLLPPESQDGIEQGLLLGRCALPWQLLRPPLTLSEVLTQAAVSMVTRKGCVGSDMGGWGRGSGETEAGSWAAEAPPHVKATRQRHTGRRCRSGPAGGVSETSWFLSSVPSTPPLVFFIRMT